MENSEFGNGLIVGWIISWILLGMLVAIFFENPIRIETKELLQPEKVLTTDGKKVDTIYVYKVNQK